jgi:hypothetical protein
MSSKPHQPGWIDPSRPTGDWVGGDTPWVPAGDGGRTVVAPPASPVDLPPESLPAVLNGAGNVEVRVVGDERIEVRWAAGHDLALPLIGLAGVRVLRTVEGEQVILELLEQASPPRFGRDPGAVVVRVMFPPECETELQRFRSAVVDRVTRIRPDRVDVLPPDGRHPTEGRSEPAGGPDTSAALGAGRSWEHRGPGPGFLPPAAFRSGPGDAERGEPPADSRPARPHREPPAVSVVRVPARLAPDDDRWLSFAPHSSTAELVGSYLGEAGPADPDSGAGRERTVGDS